MSGLCCGATPKADPTKVEMTAASQTPEPASERRAENAQVSAVATSQQKLKNVAVAASANRTFYQPEY